MQKKLGKFLSATLIFSLYVDFEQSITLFTDTTQC
jgi:hypothetical protein